MKINLNNRDVDCDPTRWPQLLSEVDQTRLKEANSKEKKYLVLGKISDNDTTIALMLKKKNEINKNYQRLSCFEIMDISSQILGENAKNNQKNLLTLESTKNIIERSIEFKDKKIKRLNIELIIKIILIISIVGIPIIFYFNRAVRKLKDHKNLLQNKLSEMNIFHSPLNENIKIAKPETIQIKKESEKNQLTGTEQKQIGEEIVEVIEENYSQDEVKASSLENKDSRNSETLNLNEKSNCLKVQEKKVLENADKSQLLQLKNQIEKVDKNVNGDFWCQLDKLIDDNISMEDKISFYQSVLFLSSIKSISPFARALKNEINIDEVKGKLRDALIKASELLKKRLFDSQRVGIDPEFFSGNVKNYGILFDKNNEIHIIRKLIINKLEKSIHAVTSLNSSELYIAGISKERDTITRMKNEKILLKKFKNQPGIPPPYEVFVKYVTGSQHKGISLQKLFVGYATKILKLAPIYQLKIFIGALQGICSLHKHKTVVCNFNITSIIYDDNCNGYLGDFEACTEWGEIQEMHITDYAAPKVLYDYKNNIDHRITDLYEDSYSVGITLLHLIDISLFGKDKKPINLLTNEELNSLFKSTREKIKNDQSLIFEEKEIKLEELELVKKLLEKPKSKLSLNIKKRATRVLKGMTCEMALKELSDLYSKYKYLER